MDELREELMQLGYPHNFQHGEPHTVEYLNRLSDIFRRRLFPAADDVKEKHT